MYLMQNSQLVLLATPMNGKQGRTTLVQKGRQWQFFFRIWSQQNMAPLRTTGSGVKVYLSLALDAGFTSKDMQNWELWRRERCWERRVALMAQIKNILNCAGLFTKLQSLVENMIINHLNSLRPAFSTVFAFSTFTKGPTPRRFLNRQAKRERLFTNDEKSIEYNPVQALALLRLHTFTTFKESVQICVRLNVNPKNGEQIVRGTANLPAGLGRKVRVGVLCSNNEFQDLKKAGVDIDFHLKESAIKELQKGTIQFDKLYTTPSHLPKLKPYGKFLGPKGLMPNIKLGTLVPWEQLPAALILAKQGQVSFRVDNGKNIHAQIGKADFTDEQLLQNWRAVMQALVDLRPPTLKGKYFTSAWVKSTMGPSWKINLVDIDPRIEKSIWKLFDEQKVQKTEEQTV